MLPVVNLAHISDVCIVPCSHHTTLSAHSKQPGILPNGLRDSAHGSSLVEQSHKVRWPSGLRRQTKVDSTDSLESSSIHLVRKGVGSNPTLIIFPGLRCRPSNRQESFFHLSGSFDYGTTIEGEHCTNSRFKHSEVSAVNTQVEPSWQ